MDQIAQFIGDGTWRCDWPAHLYRELRVTYNKRPLSTRRKLGIGHLIPLTPLVLLAAIRYCTSNTTYTAGLHGCLYPDGPPLLTKHPTSPTIIEYSLWRPLPIRLWPN